MVNSKKWLSHLASLPAESTRCLATWPTFGRALPDLPWFLHRKGTKSFSGHSVRKLAQRPCEKRGSRLEPGGGRARSIRYAGIHGRDTSEIDASVRIPAPNRPNRPDAATTPDAWASATGVQHKAKTLSPETEPEASSAPLIYRPKRCPSLLANCSYSGYFFPSRTSIRSRALA